MRRLDDIAGHLVAREDVVAVLGLGSAGVETDRFDDHSDLDVFVIVDEGSVDRYAGDVNWLAAVHPVAFHFANERHGRKVLFDDGVFVEYAVFTLGGLARLPFAGARVVWQRDDAPPGLAESAIVAPGPPFDTVEFHLGEALTNLYVGLHRELRGERLTATRFIQVFAVDRVLALLRLTEPRRAHRRDVFEATRRIEQAYPPEFVPLAAMNPGYEHNVAAATAILDWLGARYAIDATLHHAIKRLLAMAHDYDSSEAMS